MRSQDTRIDPINKEIIKKEDIPFIVKRDNFIKKRDAGRTCESQTWNTY